MLQILQTRHPEKYEKLINELGLSDEAVSVVEATEDDDITGIGVYHIDFVGGQIVIDHAEYADILLADGIYRSILFLAVLRGIEKARFELRDKSLEADLGKLGLTDEGSNTVSDINSVLNGCENCKNSL